MRSLVLLLAVAIALSASGQDQAAVSAATPLKAGAAKRSIVPPFPTPMAGFGDRSANFEGVKTPIYARALVCANGDTSVAVLATDLLWMPRELADAIRGDVSAATGIPAANILLCAAHNHSSLAGFSKTSLFGGPFNQELFDFLRQEMGQALTEAHASLRPASLGFGQGRLDGFARNRHQGNEDVIDPMVGVLRVTEVDSRTVIATLFNFTGHPVILGSDNLLLCGEYPGAAEQMVEDVLGGVALFTQGACGDVTVKRSGPPFLEVERLGRILGAEVIKTSEMTLPGSETFLFSRMEDVEVEPRVL
ncbi:MAG: neutral/alkaline non-lysosomal ceramidase N-terminal domain-containing protein, partial [Candidatus Hydrogenedentes bacterium]|nr:neutral/alkaline non-lysosomal ceramidase N-terminal domain-containing protein [Candidatus Hydrogenedentota bacterium]